MAFESLLSDGVVDTVDKEICLEQGLGDVILGIMQENNCSSMTLAELVYRFSDMAEINCSYWCRNYRVKFDNSDDGIPKVKVLDITSGKEWLVVLGNALLKSLYPRIRSKLSFTANDDKVGIVTSGVRGSIWWMFSRFTKSLGVDLSRTMNPDEMSEFLGERLFDPTRKSSHLSYIMISG